MTVAVADARVKQVVSKRPKSARIARWASWLKGTGRYVHLCHTRISEALADKLKGCQHVWTKEVKGDDVRWRGIGCGERDYCPVCGTYRQSVLAREAAEAMLLAMMGVEIWHGVRPESYGIKLVLTIPKAESKRIDDLLFTDYEAWKREVDRLFKAAYDFGKRWYGEGIGGVASLDYTGESSPAEAHYHVNLYIFPARKVGTKWEAIPHLADTDKLNSMRKSWTSRVNELYGTAVPVADFQQQYLGKAGKLRHWLNYAYRPSLSDLWSGWRGFDGELVAFDGELVAYEYGKPGKRVESYIPIADMERTFKRLEWIPMHFKRIRWWGKFSDGQRAKTMESLGLEAEEVEDDESGGWMENRQAGLLYAIPGGRRAPC